MKKLKKQPTMFIKISKKARPKLIIFAAFLSSIIFSIASIIITVNDCGNSESKCVYLPPLSGKGRCLLKDANRNVSCAIDSCPESFDQRYVKCQWNEYQQCPTETYCNYIKLMIFWGLTLCSLILFVIIVCIFYKFKPHQKQEIKDDNNLQNINNNYIAPPPQNVPPPTMTNSSHNINPLQQSPRTSFTDVPPEYNQN